MAELNQAITELLDRLNHHRFRKLEGNRTERFAKIDRPALRPLPVEAYTFAEWKKVRVNIDYHIEIERHYYSAPYTPLHRELDVRYTAMTVEIFHRGQRIASHARSSNIGGHTTDDAHRPKSHQRYLEWTPERLVRWASTIGPFTAALVDKILHSRPHPEQGFRTCLGVLRLFKDIDPERAELIAARAVAVSALTYKSIASIIANKLERSSRDTEDAIIEHPNLRGPGYFH